MVSDFAKLVGANLTADLLEVLLLVVVAGLIWWVIRGRE